MAYCAPLADLRFLLEQVVPLSPLRETERFAEVTPELGEAVLGGAARLCEEVLAPLRRVGDTHPATLENGVVRMPPGYREGFRALAEGGWACLSAPEAHGGAGLPLTLQTAVNDMMAGACLALHVGVVLTQGQIEALAAHASPALQALCLPKLVAGEWMATMNLTEPQAGSDVGALACKAVPRDDGSYAITGQKIYISFGDSDLVENVCHLVLARLPGATPGTKGISLFLVPKRLPDADGRAGQPNAVHVVSLEHKLGLHASPTCVMSYEGARGWLVGAPQGGMAAMFTMMNNARLSVATQGVGVAEAATQAAVAFALERRQGAAQGLGTIVEHADVRRMLATMRAETFAARAICLATAIALDHAAAGGGAAWAARAALLTPIAKAYGTDIGHEVAQMGLQVHGGMGYVEETGVAQYARDVRVASIYEGTNGIQAMDLVGRKLSDDGAAAQALLRDIRAEAEAARARLPELAVPVWQAAEALAEATDWMISRPTNDRFAGAAPYLRAFARVLGGHFHLRAALAGDAARAALAAVYVRRLMPEHAALLAAAQEGAAGLYALSPDDLAA